MSSIRKPGGMAGSGVVARTIKLADKTSGRDRLCRLVQYGSKLVYWLLEQEAVRPDLVKTLKGLESSLSTARKLFRLGKSVEQFRGALQAVHIADPLLRLLATVNKLARGLYLLVDHLLWAARMQLVTVNNKYWTEVSMRFWLVSILLSLLRDMYELLVVVRAEWKRSQPYSSSGGNPSPRSGVLVRVVQNNPAVVVDLVKNCGDLLIPVARLELVQVAGGAVGLAGVVSSVAGLMQVWNEGLKLKFS